MAFLSFIIPVYNTPAEKVARCLDSVRNVSAAEFECILLDDGSEASLSGAYRQLCARDSRLHYCRKENGGVSSARNAGIDRVLGSYVYFIDSDDELIPEALDAVLNLLQQQPWDLVITNIELLDSGSTSLLIPYEGAFPISCSQVLSSMTKDGRLNGPCAKLIRRELLTEHHIRFDETMINGEDAVFQLDILKTDPRMYYTDIPTYRYHRFSQTSSGRTLRFPEKILDNQILLHDRFRELIGSDRISREDREILRRQQEALFVRNLLRWALELADAGQLVRTLKDRMYAATDYVGPEGRQNLSLFGKVSLRLMKSRSALPLKGLALLRRCYLKCKTIL